MADELLLKEIQVSAGGVRGVWERHGLTTKHERLLRLEETARGRKLKLTEEQIRALERFNPEYRERHIEVHYTGDLVAVDTFFVGTLKGVGKVYLQTVLDCFSRYVWGRLYTSNLPLMDEHLRVKGRTTWYETLEEMQKDLGAYLEQYNTKRPHRGRGMEGKTPYQVFKAGLKEAKKAARTRGKWEEKEAA